MAGAPRWGCSSCLVCSAVMRASVSTRCRPALCADPAPCPKPAAASPAAVRPAHFKARSQLCWDHTPHPTSHIHPQIVSSVLAGERLEVPPAEQLPGMPEGGPPEGLDEYVSLLQRCWAQDPEQRPTFADIIPQLRWEWRLRRQLVAMLRHACCACPDDCTLHLLTQYTMYYRCCRAMLQRKGVGGDGSAEGGASSGGATGGSSGVTPSATASPATLSGGSALTAST